MSAEAASHDPKRVSLLWAGLDRADAVAGLHAKLFDPAWDEDAIRKLLDHPAATSFVAFDGETKEVVGFIMGQLAADEAEILSIGVAADWQRAGLGRRLVEGLATAVKRAEVRRLFLEVADDNEGALALYRAMGFNETGRRKDYYARNGGAAADAVTMALDLGS